MSKMSYDRIREIGRSWYNTEFEDNRRGFALACEVAEEAYNLGMEDAAGIANHWTGSLWSNRERVVACEIVKAIRARIEQNKTCECGSDKRIIYNNGENEDCAGCGKAIRGITLLP